MTDEVCFHLSFEKAEEIEILKNDSRFSLIDHSSFFEIFKKIFQSVYPKISNDHLWKLWSILVIPHDVQN